MPKLTSIHFGNRQHLSGLVRWLRLAIGLGVLAEIWLLAQTPDTARSLVLATSHQPETYTELYFVDPPHLPRISVSGQPTPFTYRIQSHQTGIATYQVYTTVIENGKANPVHAETITIAPASNSDITTSFTPKAAGEQIEVLIQIPANHLSIHFRSHS